MISKNCLDTLMEQLFYVSFTKLSPLLWFAVFPTRSALYLNYLELLILKSALLSAASSTFLNCHKLPDVSE